MRLFDFLTQQVALRPNAPFVAAKEANEWRHYSFKELQDYADRLSQLLLNKEIKAGETIAIIAHNCVEWNMVDLGALQIGIVTVPMYPTISEKDYAYIFNNAQIRYAFVGDEAIYQKVEPLLQQIESLKGISIFKKIDNLPCLSEELPPLETLDKATIEARKSSVKPDDLATLIYTSGTTGNPKGVMLSHRNIASNVQAVQTVMPFVHGKKSLSFLPLCHSFERMVFYVYLSLGLHVHYTERLDAISDHLKEVHPFCFTTVPRLLEKVYDKIMDKGNALTGWRKSLFFWAMRLGEQYELGKHKGWWYNLRLAIARNLVFSKWREALGGELSFIVTGAAAMQPRLITLFTAAGIPVIEGYGLTETSPVLAVNHVPETERCIGTVGLPLPGVELILAADGEILARGTNIMQGYYRLPEETAEAIDSEGWFHTGDIGRWETAHGRQFLKIVDRKKELFKTAGGKYIAPQVIENKLKESPFIEQIMVVGGDDKKYIAALIVPNFGALEAWADEQGLRLPPPGEIVQMPAVQQLLQDEVERFHPHFGQWEQIKKIRLLAREWTIEAGELTPTLKLKRKMIQTKYEAAIQSLFV